MDTRHLIDAIVVQTTILIAELATAAGIRAPLARVADQVFLDLARAVEAQGVGRKVVADMFGLALRTYQKKVNRLSQSVTESDTTLWQAVLDFLQQKSSATRLQIFEQFHCEDQLDLRAVLRDLVDSGFIYSTGNGENIVYGPTSVEARANLMAHDQLESAIDQVWLMVHDHPNITQYEIKKRLKLDNDLVGTAIDRLIADGRITRSENPDKATFSVSKLVIPVGSEHGWEVAVIDHFRAVTKAIAAKLRQGSLHSIREDTQGGATLGFVVHSEHPYQKEVYGLLERIRQEANQLWDKVANYNDQHSDPGVPKVKVWFYFGQNIQETNDAITDLEGADK